MDAHDNKRRMTRTEELKVRTETLTLAVRWLDEHSYTGAAEALDKRGRFWIVDVPQGFIKKAT